MSAQEIKRSSEIPARNIGRYNLHFLEGDILILYLCKTSNKYTYFQYPVYLYICRLEGSSEEGVRVFEANIKHPKNFR